MQPTDQIGYWLSRALRTVSAAAHERLRAHCAARGKAYAVTPPQWGVLAALAANGEQPVSALCQRLAVETPAITGIITRLEHNGLVQRVHDRDDRRVVLVSLTAEGRDIVHSLSPLMAEFNRQLLPAELAPAFLTNLRELIDHAAALAAPDDPEDA